MSSVKKYLLPTKLYLWVVVYFILTVLLHWRWQVDIGILIYAIGAVVGAHLLKFVEATVNMTPSPFRNLVALIVLTVLTIFVLTSSAMPLGRGVVLFLNLHFLYIISEEYKQNHDLGSWLPMIPVGNHRTYYFLFWVVFVVESLLFVLV